MNGQLDGSSTGAVVISEGVEAEMYALVWRRVRGGGLAPNVGASGLADFEDSVRDHAQRLSFSAAVGALATALARDPASKLSAADAPHLALSANDGHRLVTFDERLARAARARGYPAEVPGAPPTN